MGSKKIDLRKILKDRHHFDTHPEIGWQENKTFTYIVKTLGRGYVWTDKTAVVYKIGHGKPVFFRAELDGLATDVGVKHVCGHSAHLAALMGAYRYFKINPPVGFCIYFVFQPCEEGYPSGATFITERFAPLNKCLFGAAFHVHPGTKTGEIMVPTMAACDYFEITVMGKSTHIKNKYTHMETDCVTVAGLLASQINALTFTDALINVGILKAGATPNSIAGNAFLSGDVRSLTSVSRKRTKEAFFALTKSFKKQFPKLHITCTYVAGYPLLQDDLHLIENLKTCVPIGKNLKTYATEDFSLYTPAKLFLLVSTGKPTELHEARFRVPDIVVKKIYEYWIGIGTNLHRLIAK